MPTEVQAILADDTKGHFRRGTVKRRDCLENDVVIDIHYSGICHSDLHSVKAEWGGPKTYPFCPGHEIAGVVEEVGSNVTKFKVGDKVGVGCFVDSCRKCHQCKAGFEQYCVGGSVETYGSAVSEQKQAEGHVGPVTYGGYTQKIVVDKDFVLAVPDTVPLEYAAPLLCAGITMYSPLEFYAGNKKSKDFKVGIVGIGGLGHIGVKIAKAQGYEVVAISSSEKKREFVENILGVEYINAGRTAESVKKMAKEHFDRFDLVISTISAEFDLASFLEIVKTGGQYCFVGAPPTPFELHAFNVIGRRISIGGSLIGGIKETQDMLDFCGKHKIWADAEMISATEVNRAYTELGNGTSTKSRYIIKTKETLVDGKWDVDTSTLKDQQPHLVSPYAVIINAENTAGKTYLPAEDKFVSK